MSLNHFASCSSSSFLRWYCTGAQAGLLAQVNRCERVRCIAIKRYLMHVHHYLKQKEETERQRFTERQGGRREGGEGPGIRSEAPKSCEPCCHRRRERVGGGEQARGDLVCRKVQGRERGAEGPRLRRAQSLFFVQVRIQGEWGWKLAHGMRRGGRPRSQRYTQTWHLG